MKIIAIANQKGGCAKTTTVVNLACALGELGKKVLVIDLDPQANASQWLAPQREIDGSYELLTTGKSVQGLIEATHSTGVYLLSASQELSKIDKILAGELSTETKLKRKLATLDLHQWDYVLMDTPPTLGLLTLNACVAADSILVPVTTHVMSLSGVAQLMEKYQEIVEVLNPGLKVMGFVPSRVDLRTRHSKEVIELLKDQFGDKVFKSQIRENIYLAEAPSFAEAILTYKTKSGAAEDYRALAKEVLAKN
jgi:chromosome partitioning protein